MAYRNKTYVIFDGDNDIWAYAYMKGWKSNDNLEFNFADAHDLRPLTDRASDTTIFNRLRERLANTKQVVVLVGEKTKDLRKFVPWEIAIATKLGLPIIVVNLNGKKKMDDERCPAGLKNCSAVHIPYKASILQFALDHFPEEHGRLSASWSGGPRTYPESVYESLGL
jgi:hypothetical protein